jgi:hypothetical protein
MKSWACGSCENVVTGAFFAAYSRDAFTAA